MLKNLLLIPAFLLFSLGLFADSVLKIGATAVPHAEILEQIKGDLKQQGIDLKIIIFQDYILPNIALNKGDIDVNYFIHKVNFDDQVKRYKYNNFVAVLPVHIEPMGIYSKVYKNVTDVKNGATVLLGNSIADRGRSLKLLETAGLIKLNPNVDNLSLDLADITSNPKNLKFLPFVEAAMLPRFYNNNEADLILINTNFALENGLNPKRDAIFVENSDSPYANVVITTKDKVNDPRIVALVNALKSKKIHDFIMTKYEGAIVPVN
ncbi:Methionine-binding lipoprotein MetQ [Candidatus Hepatincola sp. Av]